MLFHFSSWLLPPHSAHGSVCGFCLFRSAGLYCAVLLNVYYFLYKCVKSSIFDKIHVEVAEAKYIAQMKTTVYFSAVHLLLLVSLFLLEENAPKKWPCIPFFGRLFAYFHIAGIIIFDPYRVRFVFIITLVIFVTIIKNSSCTHFNNNITIHAKNEEKNTAICQYSRAVNGFTYQYYLFFCVCVVVTASN